jgi:tetratricopeptide (TPR) repeat protein
MKQPLIIFPLFLLILFNSVNAGAFWLFSGESKKKYKIAIQEIKIDYEKSDCTQVIKKVNTFLESKPPSLFKEEAYLYIGSCYEKRNEIDRALDIYGLAHTFYPKNDFFREALANIYLGTGFFEKSLLLFKDLTKNKNASYKAYSGLAKSYASLGFYKKAKKNYSYALNMNEYKDLNLIKEYSRALIRIRKYEEVLAIFNNASHEFKIDAEIYLILARVWMYKGDYGRSLNYINEAQELSSTRRDIALYGIFLNIMISDYNSALSKINHLTEENNEDALALLAKAIVKLKNGNKKESYEILSGISKDKDSFVSQIALAIQKEDSKQ